MRDAGNDYQDDVGEDVRWLSYGELAEARGISTASAIRLVFRRKWRRQDGNDGIVKVAVPLGEASPQTDLADEGDGISREIGEVVRLLQTASVMLRERGEDADVMFAALNATGEQALARAEAEAATERAARKQAEGETVTERNARKQAEMATVTERDARRQAEAAAAETEARLSQIRADFERERREAETRHMTEQAGREKAEAEAVRLRQEAQARRNLGLLARVLAALRGE
jgi:hypothetical protein